MSESKKFVKHIAREAPPAKLKVKRPCIPEDTIDKLHKKYSLPTAVNKMSERGLEIFNLVVEIKGYLTKAATHKELIPIHKSLWLELRAILDEAIEKNDPGIFDQFADAWVKSEIRNETRQTSANKVGKTGDGSRAALIENFLPNLLSNKPNNPTADVILDIIEGLQSRKKRAPTTTEIVFASGRRKGKSYDKQEVHTQLKKMGLLHLMSKH